LVHMTGRHDQFFSHIHADDPLQIAIRGHLYIEGELTKLLNEAFPKPEAIDLTRVSFPLKVDLAVAIGVLRPDEKPPYMTLNKLRNRLAHNLDAEVVKSDEMDLYNALSPYHKSLLHFGGVEIEKFATPDLLGRIIYILFSAMEFRLEEFTDHKAAIQRLLTEE
jgi:hypothetical protein